MGSVGLLERQIIGKRTSLNDCLSGYIKSDDNFMDGIRAGVRDCKEGKLKPWAQVKKELRIG